MASTLVVPTLSGNENDRAKRSKLELLVEQLDPQIMRFIEINSILDQCSTQYQNIVIVDTKSFGKAYVVNGKLDSAEADEFIYSESLVHPALLLHHKPKDVFIMGGSDGSAAREVLKHRSVEKVVMCDIDQEAIEFYQLHATKNKKTFADQRLHIVYNDIKAELEVGGKMFDVIIGDVGDPIRGGGPCNRFYTKSFYQDVIKPNLFPNGIFVTQAGPAGVLSHKDIFSPIYNTIKQVFKQVIVITAPIPSYADSCGWVIATDNPNQVKFDRMTKKIAKTMSGEMHYLTPSFLNSVHLLNQTVSIRLLQETRVITDENMMFDNEDDIVEDEAPEPSAAVNNGGHAP